MMKTNTQNEQYKTITNRIKNTILETEDMGNSIVESLDNQSEQSKDILNQLDNMKVKLDNNKSLIKQVSSYFGFLWKTKPISTISVENKKNEKEKKPVKDDINIPQHVEKEKEVDDLDFISGKIDNLMTLSNKIKNELDDQKQNMNEIEHKLNDNNEEFELQTKQINKITSTKW